MEKTVVPIWPTTDRNNDETQAQAACYLGCLKLREYGVMNGQMVMTNGNDKWAATSKATGLVMRHHIFHKARLSWGLAACA